MSTVIKIEPTELESTAIEWANLYANDVSVIESMLVRSKPFMCCVVDLYQRFVSAKKLMPIEKIEQDFKKELFTKSLQILPARTPDDNRKQVCVFLYLMAFIFEKYFVV